MVFIVCVREARGLDKELKQGIYLPSAKLRVPSPSRTPFQKVPIDNKEEER
jgi:hypothetical protein